MTERLDRIESLLADTAQQLNRTAAQQDRTAAQQAKNTEDIDTLLGAIALAEARIDRLMARAEVSDQRFEVLRAEAITDRREAQQKFNDAIEQMRTDREAARVKAEANRAEARAQAEASRVQAEADREEARTQAEASRVQAEANREEARTQAETDRRKADERHSAQMEVIQTLLLELTKTNGNVTKLRDRMDGLERAN